MPFGFRQRGFTVIELLVVLAILSLLVTITLTSVRDSRARSRDVTREEDLKSLQNALTLYVTNLHVYPATPPEGLYLTGSDAVSTTLVGAATIPSIPRDPVNSGTYRYHYASANGSAYTITYYLETASIPGKSAGVQQATP